jgi:hypothetical protein
VAYERVKPTYILRVVVVWSVYRLATGPKVRGSNSGRMKEFFSSPKRLVRYSVE